MSTAAVVTTRELGAVFDGLLAADVESADGEVLPGWVADSQRVRSWLDSFDVRCINRNRAVHPEPTPRGDTDRAKNLLTKSGRRSNRDARAAANRADTCAKIPELGAALQEGAATADHVDGVNRATAGVDEPTKARLAEHGDELAAAASQQSPEQFEKTCRELVRSLSGDDGSDHLQRLRARRRCSRSLDAESGMDRTTLLLDPVTGDIVWTAIHAAINSAHAQRQDDDTRTWEQFVADVVVDLITGKASAGGSGRPEISVLVDFDTLVHGPHADTVCETFAGTTLPVGTLRRLLCDAAILPITLNGESVPVDVGRASRTATPAQRLALRALYPTCGHPGCTVTFDDCRIHHIVYWSNHGRSDLANLIPLCETHHHLVHEGGWQLTIDPDRTITLRTADGQLFYRGNTTNPLTTKNRRRRQRCTNQPGAPTSSSSANAPPHQRTSETRPPESAGARRPSTADPPTAPAGTAHPDAVDGGPVDPDLVVSDPVVSDPAASETTSDDGHCSDCSPSAASPSGDDPLARHDISETQLLDPLLDDAEPLGGEPSNRASAVAGGSLTEPERDPVAVEPPEPDRPPHVQAVFDLAERAAQRAARRAGRQDLTDTG